MGIVENIETELTFKQNPPFYNFLMTKILPLYDKEEGIELDFNDIPECITGVHDCFVKHMNCKIYFARYIIKGFPTTCVIYDENK